MVDLIPYVSGLLEKASINVELSYEDIETELPLAVLSEVSNTTDAAPDGIELLSGVTIQIDLYEIDEQHVHELAASVSSIMIAAGFKRSVSEFIKEDNLCRQMMRFTTIVDESANRLYRGASY